MIKRSFLLLAFISVVSYAKAQKIILLQQGKQSSIRGLSVVNDQIAWISGSNGYIALTTDGGKNWDWQRVKGFEKADFRDIEAFSAKEAIVMASGTPAIILKTINGGKSWQVKYRNNDTVCFLDAMDFSNRKHGIVLGDPIKGKFLLLETKNGGESWQPLKNAPEATPGEAAFAASGTCLRITANTIDIATGGAIARHISSKSPYQDWYSDNLPIVQGKASQGAFSMDTSAMIFVGGDYTDDKNNKKVACWYNPAIASIKNGWDNSIGMSGYQSCVEQIGEHTHLSTGTSGSNISYDFGKTWTKIDNASFNVCRKARNGKLVLLAGNNGRIAIFKL